MDSQKYIGSSFSFRNKMARVIWGLVVILFFRHSPRIFHAWRAMILRIFGAKVGKNVRVYPKVKIWAPWNVVLGDNCGIGNYANLYSQGIITIGKRCVVSQGAHLVAGTHDYNQWDFPLITKPIIIEDYVWIAAEAFIHPGVRIEEGCVIGARSVVVKNMPRWMVCAGNPCLPIKERINFLVKVADFG